MLKSIQITETPSSSHRIACVYCHADSELGDHMVVCDSCQSSHHFDCWMANDNQCAVFGCDGSSAITPLREGGIEQSLSTLSPSLSVPEGLLFFIIALIISPLCLPVFLMSNNSSWISRVPPLLLILMIAVVLGIALNLFVRLAIRMLSNMD